MQIMYEGNCKDGVSTLITDKENWGYELQLISLSLCLTSACASHGRGAWALGSLQEEDFSQPPQHLCTLFVWMLKSKQTHQTDGKKQL